MSRFVSLCRVMLMGFVVFCFSEKDLSASCRTIAIKMGREIGAKELLAEKQKNEELIKKIQDSEKQFSQKDEEIDLLNQQLDDLKRRNADLESQSAEVSQQLDQERDQNTQTALAISQLTSQISILTEQLKTLESDLHQTRQEKELTVQEKQALAEKVRQEETRRDEVRAALDTNQNHLAELQKKLDQSNHSIQELEHLKNHQIAQSQEIERLSLENKKRHNYIKKCRELTAKVSQTIGTNITSPLSLLTHLSEMKPEEPSALFQSGARLNAVLGGSNAESREPSANLKKKQAKHHELIADRQSERSNVPGPAENIPFSVFPDPYQGRNDGQSQILDALLSPTRQPIGRRPAFVAQVRAFGSGLPVNVQEEIEGKIHQKKSKSDLKDDGFQGDQSYAFLDIDDNDQQEPLIDLESQDQSKNNPEDQDPEPRSPLKRYQLLAIANGDDDEGLPPPHDQGSIPSLSTDFSNQNTNEFAGSRLDESLSLSRISRALGKVDPMTLDPLIWVRSAYLGCLSAILPKPVFDNLLYYAEQTDRFSRAYRIEFGKPWPLPVQIHRMGRYADHFKGDELKQFFSNGREVFIKKEQSVTKRLSHNDAYGEPWIDNGGW